MTEHQVFEPVGPAKCLRQQMLDAPCLGGIRLCLEIDRLVAEPAPVAVTGAQPIDLADIFGASHSIDLADPACRKV